MECETTTTSPQQIENPSPLLSGDRTPPNLVIDLEREESPPKESTDPLSDSKMGGDEENFTEWIPSPGKKGEFFPTKAENNPRITPSPLKTQSKSVPFNKNSDAMHFHEGEGENLLCTHPY